MEKYESFFSLLRYYVDLAHVFDVLGVYLHCRKL